MDGAEPEGAPSGEHDSQGLFPSLVAPQVKQGIVDYLHTTFGFSDPALKGALDALVDREPGVFKGPYISVRLPYQKATDADGEVPLVIRPPFTPYRHQMRAFIRLSTLQGREPRHTLVTTGTGSGKTECFLYPILDHCFRTVGQKGIKALLLYPMNALATDQAQRLARVIHGDERLRGRVRAGLYVGDGDAPRSGKKGGRESSRFDAEVPLTTEMSEESLITDRRALRDDPPDILLTNYRMLDFLLLRPEDRVLWAKNGEDPTALRYLVLDEVHTYDGAQGSDVACLLRRLRRRIGLAPDGAGFTCIGTSATVAADAPPSASPASGNTSSGGSLLGFASTLFGVSFGDDAVVGEERVPAGAFCDPIDDDRGYPSDPTSLAPLPGERFGAYAIRQSALWWGREVTDPVELGGLVRQHPLFSCLIERLGGRPRAEREMIERLSFDHHFDALPDEARLSALRSFLSLVAFARRRDASRLEPLVAVTVHLWLRELRRLVRVVDVTPSFRFDADGVEDRRHALPVWYCRECGVSGWLTMQRRGDHHFSHQLPEIYRAFFGKSDELRYLLQHDDDSQLPGTQLRIDPQSLSIVADEEMDGRPTVPVRVWTSTSDRRHTDTRTCPSCETGDALTIAGAQNATLGSVAVNQLFGTRLALDKKLLAFTDSVQDAAHLAGFFTGRTFRFNLRAAFMQPLLSLVSGAPPACLPLDDLGRETLAHVDAILGVPKATAELQAPDLAREAAYRAFLDAPTETRSPELQQALLERLQFEAVLEFGYSARVGRTLSKVGCAALVFDEDRLRIATERLALLVEGDSPELFARPRQPAMAMRQFLLGLLHRLAWRGGIEHPWLRSFCQDDGNRYLLSKRHNPRIAPMFLSRRAPVFASLDPRSRGFEKWLPADRWTFVTDWAVRCFGGQTVAGRLGADLTHRITQVYRHVARVLIEAELLVELGRHDGGCLGLSSKKLSVTKDVQLLRCGQRGCGHALTLSPNEASAFVGEPCIRFRCSGRYEADLRDQQVFYRSLYMTGDLKRVFGSEHTGLLTRAEREETERGFKQGVPADAPNVLTCTSTLEMGIDIGDLSATLLCGVPPSVASFVQRAGRAGRTTGNAVIVTQARSRAQDLYFFDEPLDMVAGSVTAPGTFLNAPEMLTRQFVAFTLDEWGRKTPQAKIPHNVQELLASFQRGHFPVPWLDFVDAERGALLSVFREMFKDVLDQDSFERLAESIALVRPRMEQQLQGTKARLEELRTFKDRLKERLKVVEADITRTQQERDQEAFDFRRDHAQLDAQSRAINAAWGLDWFVDSGFLPNYALSEPGVTLNASIEQPPTMTRGADGVTARQDRFEDHSWRRPASMALREFAPFNTFYASGRRVVVDRVVVGTRKQTQIAPWIFCSRCAFCAPAAQVPGVANCPDCKAPGFGETGQKRDVVILVEVAARMPHDEAQVLDGSDERERERYFTESLFRVATGADHQAFADEDRGFGYEWVSRMELRELNLGVVQERPATMRLHDADQSAPGFRLCDDCGVVADPRTPDERVRHLARCRTRREGQEQWRDTFLLRSSTSEAIRVLVPAAVDTERRLANFRAALHLGLRLKFGGSPGHLVVRTMSEPGDAGPRKHFLVLYDNVPGGTGYLKELVKKEGAFLDLFRLALDRLRACPCTRNGHATPTPNGEPDAGDGCYRCLYTRESIDDVATLSKRATIDQLVDLLSRMNLTSVKTLSDVATAKLADSELELLFLARLIEHAKAQGFNHSQAVEAGWAVHTFRRGRERLVLRPQVDLGPKEGVAVPSRPDFVLEARVGARGERVERRPIAVFCDGFAFHAQLKDGSSRLIDDVKKRSAILQSGRYRVWSITWEDLARGDLEKPLLPILPPHGNEGAFDQMAAKQLEQPDLVGLLGKGSLHQLFRLAQCDDAAWGALAGALWSSCATKPPKLTDELGWTTLTASALPGSPPGDSGDLVVAQASWPHVGVALVASMKALTTTFRNRPAEALRFVIGLDDTPEVRNLVDDSSGKRPFATAWQRFLLWGNLLQGAGEGSLRTVEADAAGVQGGTAMSPSTSTAAGWVSDVDPRLAGLAGRLAEAGVPTPQVLADLGPPVGAGWGQAELAWLNARVAILHPEADFAIEDARHAGWVVFVGVADFDITACVDRIRSSP